MAEIVGTITNLSDFLSKTQVCLSVKPNDPQQQIICLEADRKYSIPAFQREVRWDDNNLKMLLYDLSRSSKFLGNIILTIKSDHTCEIIDGQQRTTVLMSSFMRFSICAIYCTLSCVATWQCGRGNTRPSRKDRCERQESNRCGN